MASQKEEITLPLQKSNKLLQLFRCRKTIPGENCKNAGPFWQIVPGVSCVSLQYSYLKVFVLRAA
jgi:hypothetical protein